MDGGGSEKIGNQRSYVGADPDGGVTGLRHCFKFFGFWVLGEWAHLVDMEIA